LTFLFFTLIVFSGKKNARQSPLLCLPAEIRNMIWKYAFSGKVRVSSTTVVPRKDYDRFSLLRVCRQVYHETGVLPYTTNTFCFSHISIATDFQLYLKPKQVKYIQSLVIEQYCPLFSFNAKRICAIFQLPHKFTALEKVCVVLYANGEDVGSYSTSEPKVDVRAVLEGKDVMFRYFDRFSERLKVWQELY
jgi:hypothetical protein